MHPFALLDRSSLAGGDAQSGDRTAASAGISSLERGLWLVVLAVLVLDVATTAYGLSVGLVERNPLVRGAIDSIGLVVLPVLKLGVVAVALACRRICPTYAFVVPLGLAIPWTLAVGINLALILSV